MTQKSRASQQSSRKDLSTSVECWISTTWILLLASRWESKRHDGIAWNLICANKLDLKRPRFFSHRSILAQAFLKYADIEPGMVVEVSAFRFFFELTCRVLALCTHPLRVQHRVHMHFSGKGEKRSDQRCVCFSWWERTRLHTRHPNGRHPSEAPREILQVRQQDQMQGTKLVVALYIYTPKANVVNTFLLLKATWFGCLRRYSWLNLRKDVSCWRQRNRSSTPNFRPWRVTVTANEEWFSKGSSLLSSPTEF